MAGSSSALCSPQRDVPEYCRTYIDLWNETPSSFPAFSRTYNCGEKRRSEEKFSRLINSEKLDRARMDGEIVIDARRLKLVKKAMKAFRFGKPDAMDEFDTDVFMDRFSRVTEEFSAMAKNFDAGVRNDDIHQALRNLWIINTIQSCLGKRVSLTPSGFAYSMIYPYSDNYLDAPEISSGEKKDFCGRLERRLCGEHPQSNNENEARIFRLIGMIEGEFRRDRFPEVYESLLAIHHAQLNALCQQWKYESLSAADLLALSVEKGGTSVLADGFLANGVLEFADADFLFGFGVSLQFIDDLQDIEEDLANGHTSLFSREASFAPLDGIVNRLLNFGSALTAAPGLQKSPDARGIVNMIEKSSKALIFESIAVHPQLFSLSFIEKIERHSPLGFEYIRSMEEKRRHRQVSEPRVRLAVA